MFLDEVGECDPAMQAKILRVLQPPDDDPCHRVFCRVGESQPLTSNVRIIAATNRDLFDDIAQHQFREDLYYRLAVISIQLPALRDRREDIASIAGRLLERINRDFARQEPGYRARRLAGSALELNLMSPPGMPSMSARYISEQAHQERRRAGVEDAWLRAVCAMVVGIRGRGVAVKTSWAGVAGLALLPAPAVKAPLTDTRPLNSVASVDVVPLLSALDQ